GSPRDRKEPSSPGLPRSRGHSHQDRENPEDGGRGRSQKRPAVPLAQEGGSGTAWRSRSRRPEEIPSRALQMCYGRGRIPAQPGELVRHRTRVVVADLPVPHEEDRDLGFVQAPSQNAVFAIGLRDIKSETLKPSPPDAEAACVAEVAITRALVAGDESVILFLHSSRDGIVAHRLAIALRREHPG